jgi:hypothetical protein
MVTTMEGEGARGGHRALEQELCRIPDVNAARIVADESGRPVEVHILASPAKHAKQIVRDVQSVAIAAFGLDIDRRIISVVQLDLVPSVADVGPAVQEASAPIQSGQMPQTAAAAPFEPVAPPRIVIEGVSEMRSGTDCSIQVSLRRDDDRAIGITEGLLVGGSTLRLAATSTLAALRQLEPVAAKADIEHAVVVRVGERSVAVASVVFVATPHEEVLVGVAVVGAAGEHDAMARAILDATNRRLRRTARSGAGS